MNENNTHYYTIFNQRLAGFLMLHGFPLIRLAPNWSNSKNGYIFKDSSALYDYINLYQVEKLR